MHMNAPITIVVCSVVTIRSGWKSRVNDMRGSAIGRPWRAASARRRCCSSHTGLSLTFARIHSYISMAVPLLWTRQKDAVGAIGLAVNASRERNNGHPDASERIQELLTTAQELWRDCADLEDDERVRTFRTAIQLVNLADMVSLTTRA